MKKVILSLIVASVLVACNNGGGKTEVVTDSTKVVVDSAKVDSVKVVVDSAKVAVDTTKK